MNIHIEDPKSTGKHKYYLKISGNSTRIDPKFIMTLCSNLSGPMNSRLRNNVLVEFLWQRAKIFSFLFQYKCNHKPTNSLTISLSVFNMKSFQSQWNILTVHYLGVPMAPSAMGSQLESGMGSGIQDKSLLTVGCLPVWFLHIVIFMCFIFL